MRTVVDSHRDCGSELVKWSVNCCDVCCNGSVVCDEAAARRGARLIGYFSSGSGEGWCKRISSGRRVATLRLIAGFSFRCCLGYL